MAKQLTRKEYIMSFVLLIMFAISAAAFLWGVEVGKSAAEKRYAHFVEPVQTVPDELQTYDQRYLTSFYHTIYLPYREFSEKWFDHMETIELMDQTVNPEALLNELQQLAVHTYEEIQEIAIPESAASIHESHRHYLSSLNLFKQALDDRALKRKRGSSLVAALKENSFIQEAEHYALKGQASFYLSIAKWEQSENPKAELPVENVETPISKNEWNQMTFTGKSYIAAKMLEDLRVFSRITPPDVAANIDHLLRTGQAGELGLKEIDEMVETLIHMNTVRYGDFIDQKKRYYANEKLPHIPLFFD